MRNASSREPLRTIFVLGLLLFCSALPGSAQTPLPLGLNNNYMVTGDYVVGGWTKTGSATIGGALMSTGTINVPDPGAYATNAPLQQVPAGADIVAAFLYWGTVENSGTFGGQNGRFRGYPISGTILGNPKAPVSWSSGGCAGSSQGSKTMVSYRADVTSLMPLDPNGNVQANTSYQVSLPDTAKAGQPPYALGATLVIIYRLLAPTVPLTSVVIYDGAYAPSNASQTVTQPLLGFFQAGNDQGGPIVAKITHIVGNGQSNKNESVSLNGVNLLSLYGTLPPFPGSYNGTWDNPTWFPNALGNAVKASDSSATTSIVPASSNKGCVSWGAIVMSTTVQDSDLDGLLDTWKTNQGYCDPGANNGLNTQGTCPSGTSDLFWVALPGATRGSQDVFLQLDYMCTKVINNADGTTTCDPSGISYKPSQQVISNLTSAFSSNGHNINMHVFPDDGNVILAQSCTDNTAVSPPIYCPFPNQAGMVGWAAGFTALKTQPLNYPDETSCDTRTPPGGAAGSGPLCRRRFQPGKNNSYHEVIFGIGTGTPNWSFLDGNLTGVSWSGNTVTFTTSAPHGLVPAVSASDINPNARVTVSDAISNPNLNNTYLVASTPTSSSFTINVSTSATTTYTKTTDPFLTIGAGVASTRSGVSAIGGADSLVTLGLWGPDGQTDQVQSGTLMHELGHSLALTHGGLYRTQVQGGYSFSFDPNCKVNYQSIMNYFFQVDLLDGVLDYSEQVLNPVNESTASAAANVLGNPIHPTVKWYAPNQAFGSPATSHCDGTPLLPADQPMFRLQGPADSLSWAANQDMNFDGQIEMNLQGYNDWANLDLRQIGATGNNSWAGGGVQSSKIGGGVQSSRIGGGVQSSKIGGGVQSSRIGGGVGEITVQAANSIVRNPTKLSATVPSSNTVQLSFTPPGFGQNQIAAFNIYRSINGAAFSQPPYATVTVTGTPLPLPDPITFTDTKVACTTYSYFVTTVLSDGRESVASNTAGPISVPCTFLGFLSPLKSAGTLSAPTFSGTVNRGSAVPLKWEVLNANGNPIGDLSTLKLIQACPTTGSAVPPASSTIPPCVLLYSPTAGAKGNSTFRFSSPQFIFNWDTASTIGSVAGYFTIELTLSDGSTVKTTTIQFH
jgi:hypothetical protein